jgi:hypothetical protein
MAIERGFGHVVSIQLVVFNPFNFDLKSLLIEVGNGQKLRLDITYHSNEWTKVKVVRIYGYKLIDTDFLDIKVIGAE